MEADSTEGRGGSRHPHTTVGYVTVMTSSIPRSEACVDFVPLRGWQGLSLQHLLEVVEALPSAVSRLCRGGTIVDFR